MTALALLPIFFLSPTYCPPTSAQIHWTGVKHRLGIQGMVVEGVIFDRDQNRRVSSGDIMRIDDARRHGKSVNISQPWLKLGGALAKEVRRSVKRNRHVKSVCIGRISVRGVSRIRTSRALAKRLRNGQALSGSERSARARAVMEEKVDRLCKNGRNLEVKELSKMLLSHATRRVKSVSRGRLKRIANTVAQENSRRCGHLDIHAADLTF
jgi:hypothetical protein